MVTGDTIGIMVGYEKRHPSKDWVRFINLLHIHTNKYMTILLHELRNFSKPL